MTKTRVNQSMSLFTSKQEPLLLFMRPPFSILYNPECYFQIAMTNRPFKEILIEN